MPTDRKPLTDLAVKNAECRASRYELPDPKTPGLYLVVQPSGVKAFAFRYRFAGQARKLTLGQYPGLSLGQARKAVEQHRGTLARSIDPAAQKRDIREEEQRKKNRAMVADLCERYISEWTKAKNKSKSAGENERYCRRLIIPELGRRFVDEITFEEIETFLYKVLHRQTAAQKERKGGGGGDNIKAPVTANRVRSVLSKMFNLAETKFKMRPRNSNPVKGTPHNTERLRRRLAQTEELPRLAEALDFYAAEYPRKVAALWVLFLSGARVNEVNAATASEFRGDRIVKASHKTDAHIGAKEILLPPQAQAVLQRMTLDASGLLFGAGELRPVWEHVRERARCPTLQLRDARRTFASAAKSAGKTLEQAAAMLHHESVQTTRRYAWLFETAARVSVDETADALTGFMRGCDNLPHGKPVLATDPD